ncbi:uncharacterized protein LOC34622114, partial [Cyclospora cayetanensis]|uniref:Uncharacterized protein LOC34622114 n=1 Tax=Cyclospora cayetanensis TaxID=88456 RepID=A0A6P6RSL1_9EIME
RSAVSCETSSRSSSISSHQPVGNSESRQTSIPASVAASTAPSAAFCVESSQMISAAATSVHSPQWLQGKLPVATALPTHAGGDSTMSTKFGLKAARDLAFVGEAETMAPSATPDAASAGGRDSEAPHGGGGAAAAAADCRHATSSPSVGLSLLAGLGNVFLGFGASSSGLPAATAATAAESESKSALPLGSCRGEERQPPPAPEKEGVVACASVQEPRTLPSSEPSIPCGVSPAATAAATAKGGGVGLPAPAVRREAAPCTAEGGDVGSQSAACGSRLPSLASDCVHARSGTLPRLESLGSSGTPARVYRWHSSGYGAWGGGSSTRGVPSGGEARVGGRTHCEMMQALKKQADIKASVDKAVLLFNKEGIHAALQCLGERKLIDSQDPSAIARFLYETPGLDKKKVGEVLGGCSSFSMLILQSFASLCDYRGLSIDEALRQFLSKFRPPGEAQQVYRLLYRFASLYVRDNEEHGLDLDTVHFLAYAILMLHTDRHNPKVKRKMTKEQFRKIVAAGGAQLPDEVVDCMYDRVVIHEFRLNITDTDRVYSRLVNDPRALRHLPGSFSRGVSESGVSPPSQLLQQSQPRSENYSGVGGGATENMGMWGGGKKSSSSGSSSSSMGAAGGLVCLGGLMNPPSTSDASGVLATGEEGSGADAMECIDSTLFVEGSVFVKLCRNGRMKRRLIRVTPDHCLLLWSAPNSSAEESSSRQPPSSLALEELVDITVGCLYTTAKKFDLTDEMEARCVSLQFLSRRLDLFAAGLSNSTFTRWIAFFHQKVAQQQLQRQLRLRQEQQQMSHQKRLCLLNESRARREAAAARKLEVWRDEVLPFWDASWTCEAIPVAAPSRPSPLAVFVSFATTTTSALIRLPRSMVLKHLNRSHRLGLLQRSTPASRCFRRDTVSMRRLRKGVQASATLAVSMGRSTSRQLRKLASLPSALGGCTGLLSGCAARNPEDAAQEEALHAFRRDSCFFKSRRCRRSRGSSWIGGAAGGSSEGNMSALAQQTRAVGSAVAAEANAYIQLSHLGSTWVGRYSLDRGRRMDTATHPAFVRLWLGGLPGELRGKMWLIALGNEQNIGVPLLDALIQLGRLQHTPPTNRGSRGSSSRGSSNRGSSSRGSSSRGSSRSSSRSSSSRSSSSRGSSRSSSSRSSSSRGSSRGSSSRVGGVLDYASGYVLPSTSNCVPFSTGGVAPPTSPAVGEAPGGASPILEALRTLPIRGIPYLMARKVGEGPLLLTTALDELREEGTLSHGGDLDMGSAEGGAGGALAEDMSADNFAPVAVPAGDSKKKGVSPSRGAAAEQGNGGAGGAPVPSSSALAVAKAAGGAPFVPKPKPLPRQLSGDAKRFERAWVLPQDSKESGRTASSKATSEKGTERSAERGPPPPLPGGAAAVFHPKNRGHAALFDPPRQAFSLQETAGASTGTGRGGGSRERPSSVDGASGPSRGSCKMRSAGTLSVATVEREKKNVSGGSPGGGMSAFPAGSASLAAEVGSGGLAAVESPAGLPVVAPSPGGGVCEKAEITIGEGVRLLLEAYVLYRPDVGYVRGMDCLAAMLLCFLPLDLAFVALANLLPSFHLLDFFCPALPCNRRSIALKFDFFESMLRLRLPHLYRHLAGLQVIPDLYLMRWMETLFCRTLPFATLCRTWDGVLLMGEPYCFQVALGLLKYHESELLCNSFEGCLSILNRHAQPTADEDGTFDAPRFFKCVEVCRIDSHQYGRWVANQRMSEEKAELLELVACSTV